MDARDASLQQHVNIDLQRRIVRVLHIVRVFLDKSVLRVISLSSR